MEFKLKSTHNRQSFKLPQEPPSSQVNSPQNVVFISIDDLNDWIGVLDGYADVKTPNIDRLASQGMVFENAHTPIPVCNPARTSTLTGLQPDTTGIFTNQQDWRENIPDGATIPEYFRNNGYQSIGGGKLFHYNKPDAFDQYFKGSDVQLPKNRKGRFGTAALQVPDSDYQDVQVAEFASDYLSQNHDAPFFLGVGFSRPHVPLTAPQEFFDLYPLEDIQLPNVNATDDLDDVPLIGQQLAGNIHESILKRGDWAESVQAYLANISFMDAQVGKVLDAIENNNLADNTVIALWSDHGWHLGEKLHWAKTTLWEEATRVPLIISAPGVTEPGTSTDAPVSLVDLFPTLIDLTGITPNEHLEGHSLTPLLQDPQADWQHAAVSTWDNSYAIRTQRWRYIRYWDGTEELYDHLNDPNEFQNLANARESLSTKARLSQQLDDYLAEFAPARLPNTDSKQILKGNRQDDILTGGKKNDTLIGQGGNDTIFGGAGENDLRGEAGNDFITHVSQQPGRLSGGAGKDRLIGGESDDTLNGGIGGDILEGRGGNDTYVVNTSGDRIINSTDNRGDTVIASVNWTLPKYLSRLTLAGKAIIGKGNDENNRVTGNQQDNILDGDSGIDFLIGNDGDDSLLGGLGADRLMGGDGDDTLNGEDGIDIVRASNDRDFRISNQRLLGEGRDRLIDIERANISGGAGNNTLDASAFSRGSVKLRGRQGNDTLTGGAKNDHLDGGAGIDTLILRAKQKTVRLSNHQSQGAGIDQLESIERAVLLGNGEANLIDASRFKGDTRIEGKQGNDTLIPSQHTSRLVGDEGADSFVINRRNGSDIEILDFERMEGDVIKIEHSILGQSFKASQHIEDKQFAVGSQIESAPQRFFFNPDDNFLWFDIDGLGERSANRLVKVNTRVPLTAQDLRVI